MTLVELMIAGVISIIVGLIVIQLMAGSNRASNRLDGIAQAQENARFSMSWLTQQIRRAGYVGNAFSESAPGIAEQCTSNLIPPADNADCTYEGTTTSASGDRIAIRRLFVSSATNDWTTQTCSGASISFTTNSSGEYLVDVYWVEADSDTTNNPDVGDDYDDWLRCATYRESTGKIIDSVQTIASGIESMQLLYADPGADSSATRYRRSSDITNEVESPLSSDGTLVAKADVTAVRIAILARAFSDAAQLAGDRSYVLLDGEPLVFDDRVPRQVLETTIFLPNRPLSGSL